MTETITHDQELRLVWDKLRNLVFNDNRRRETSAAVGLSWIKVKALRRLLVRSMPMRDLAQELGTDKPYVTQIVGALEERGLVTRTVSADDRRCRIVALTDAGRETARRSEEILTRPPGFLTALPKQDLAELARIVANMPSEPGGGEPS